MTAAFLSDTLGAAGIARERLVLSLANNHMLDQGIEGFAETRRSARRAGHRDHRRGGRRAGSRTVDPRRSQHRLRGIHANGAMRAAQDFAGRVTMLDDLARDDFAALRTTQADLTCVVAHWDWEFRHFPQPADQGAGAPPGRHTAQG